MLRPALIALQFLTCLPVRLEPPPREQEVGRSLLWYPAVGLLIGLLLWGTAVVSVMLGPLLAAALTLIVWVLCTGALHLDGLADTVDAWVGGRGDRARTLELMKDPHAGPFAVVALVGVLLLKFAALATLMSAYLTSGGPLLRSAAGLGCACILPPLLARAAVPPLFAHTPYVRAAGLGSALTQYQWRAGGRAAAAITVLAVIALCTRAGALACVTAAVVVVLMRRAFVARLGGVTGDCVGAMIEIIEALTLTALLAL